MRDFRDSSLPRNINGAKWLGSNKPAIHMSQFEWFIGSVLNGNVLPSDAPAAKEGLMVVAADAIFGDKDYLDQRLNAYTDEWNKLPYKDKVKDKLSDTAKAIVKKRNNILYEQKRRIEILKRIVDIILLMKDSKPILKFYELWLEMMTKTMSNDVPNIPLFRKFSSRPLDFDDVGDIGNPKFVCPIYNEYCDYGGDDGHDYGGEYKKPSQSLPYGKRGLPWWKETDNYETKFGNFPIENPELCNVNSPTIKELMNQLYRSTSVEEVKSLLKPKQLLLGIAQDKNSGCDELGKEAQQEYNELKDYIRKLHSSAGGGIKRKLKTRRKSRKVRNGRRKCRKSRRDRRSHSCKK
jgi:hypothetical protein